MVTLEAFAVGILLLLYPHITGCNGIIGESFIASNLCGRNKILHQFETFYVLKNQSPIDCSLKCSRHDDCVSFNYITSSSECHLSKGVMSETCNNVIEVTDGVNYEKASKLQDCLHGGTRDSSNADCTCIQGYIGSRCERIMNDCTEGVPYYSAGYHNLYVNPKGAPAPFTIQCDMTHGGRNQIQSRLTTGYRHRQLTWAEYRDGFSGNGYLWSGLHKMYLLSKSRKMKLTIELRNPYTKAYRRNNYYDFQMTNENDEFKILKLGKSNLEMPNCMSALVGASFSTFDKDNDQNSSRNCASDYGAGWWFYAACAPCNPNGNLKIPPGGNSTGAEDEIFWNGVYWSSTMAKMWLT